MAFQGNAFQGDAFQLGPQAPEVLTIDKWLTDSPVPAPKRIIGAALAVAIGAVWVPTVETPRAEAVTGGLSSYDKIVPYQAMAFTPFVQTAAETVTCDKWINYSVGPFFKTFVPPAGAFEPPWANVASPTNWLTDSPRPPPPAPRPPSTSTAPVFADVTSANPDKWLTDSPIPAPAKARPPSSFVTAVFADVTSANPDKWLTDSPLPIRPKPRAQFQPIEPPWEGAADPLGWQTDSPMPLRVKPRQQTDVVFLYPIVQAEVVTLDKWLAYNVGPFYPKTPQNTGGYAFVERPDDITLDMWTTASPIPPPARVPQQPLPYSWSTFTPVQIEIVTVDKWLAYNVGPFYPRVPQNIGAYAFVERPDDITLDMWLGYSVGPFRSPRPLESVLAAPVTSEFITIDKWLSYSLNPTRKVTPPPPQTTAEPPWSEPSIASPLAWLTNAPLLPAKAPRDLTTFSWGTLVTPAPPPEVITPDKWLPTYPYPRLQGNKQRPIDVWSVSPTQPGETPPNPVATAQYRVFGQWVTEPFITPKRVSGTTGLSLPWTVKKRTI